MDLREQTAAAFRAGAMDEVLRLACEAEQATGTRRPPERSVPVMVFDDEAYRERCCPGVYRTLSGVNRAVRGVFGSLVRGSGRWPLYLWGPVGTGKTCAALALCDYTRGRYWSMESIVDELFESYRGSGSSATNLWSDVARPPIAVLDEIGGRAVSDTVYGAVKHFWESRQEHGNVAVYVSNLSPDQLQQVFDDRIASRLTCGTVLELSGADRRLAP